MLKRIVLFIALLIGTAGISQAWNFEKNPDRNVFVKYNQTLATTVVSTSAIIIDLSDTTNWPHSDEGEIQVNWLRVSVDKLAASSATVKIGVVNFVNSSTGSVTWFHSVSSLHNLSNTNVGGAIDLQPSWISLKAIPGVLTEGITPYVLSNDTTEGSTTYQDDVTLPTTLGTYTAPGVGDIVVALTKPGVASTAIFTIEILYHVIRR